jgi:hypothetical protein
MAATAIVSGSVPSAAGDPFGSTLLVGDSAAVQVHDERWGDAPCDRPHRPALAQPVHRSDQRRHLRIQHGRYRGSAKRLGGDHDRSGRHHPAERLLHRDGGLNLDANDDLAPTLSSPMFNGYDYAAAGVSAGNTNVQYEDAVMRSQFDQVGKKDGYDLLLGKPTVRIDVQPGTDRPPSAPHPRGPRGHHLVLIEGPEPDGEPAPRPDASADLPDR